MPSVSYLQYSAFRWPLWLPGSEGTVLKILKWKSWINARISTCSTSFFTFFWNTFVSVYKQNLLVITILVVVGFPGCVLKVFLPNVSPVSVAGIFRGQESEAQFLIIELNHLNWALQANGYSKNHSDRSSLPFITTIHSQQKHTDHHNHPSPEKDTSWSHSHKLYSQTNCTRAQSATPVLCRCRPQILVKR